MWIQGGCEVQTGHRINREMDGLVTLCSRRVHVDIARQLHLGRHRNATPGNANAIGLFQGNLQMRRFNRVGNFLPQFWEELRNHAISGEAFAVFRVEKFLSNDSLGVDEEVPGPRHTFELSYSFGVQYLVRLDHLGVMVGEQWKVNLAAVREILEYFYAVVADRRHLDPLPLESRSCSLQLDQLAFTVRSPV